MFIQPAILSKGAAEYLMWFLPMGNTLPPKYMWKSEKSVTTTGGINDLKVPSSVTSVTVQNDPNQTTGGFYHKQHKHKD
jgi:hypothetical protein